MNTPVVKHRSTNSSEISRFLLVGMIAATVHFGVLFLLREMAGVHIAFANWFGAAIGIVTSYGGNAIWVFQTKNSSVETVGSTRSNLRGPTAICFVLLYSLISLGHGLGLWLWTLVNVWSYQLGFCLLTLLSATETYVGNKQFVFVTKVSAKSSY